MVNKLPSKLYNLAKSILENGGIDPSILPNIVPYSKGSADYIVMEGNRRITALKIINDIFIIQDTPHYEKFKKMIDKYDLSKLPKKIYCILYEAKEDTYFWTYLRHSGELNGIGLVTWNPTSIDRFKIGTKQDSPKTSYYIIRYLNDNTSYQFDNSRFATTLNRIVDSSIGKNYYGLNISNEQLVFSKDEKETTEKLLLLIDNIQNKSITSRNTNTVIEIQNWIDRLDAQYQSSKVSSINKSEGEWLTQQDNSIASNTTKSDINNKTEIPSKTEMPDKPEKDNNLLSNNNGSNSVVVENKPGQEQKKDSNQSNGYVRTKKLFEDLNYFHLDPTKANGIIKIGNELTKLSKGASGGNYIAYPVATAMLLRAFIEQAFKYYLEKQKHWSILCSNRKNQNGDPALGEILTYCRNNKKVLFSDKTQLRLFGILFDSDSTIKDYLDLNIHHPNVVTVTNIELCTFSNLGLSGFLNYLIR